MHKASKLGGREAGRVTEKQAGTQAEGVGARTHPTLCKCRAVAMDCGSVAWEHSLQ